MTARNIWSGWEFVLQDKLRQELRAAGFRVVSEGRLFHRGRYDLAVLDPDNPESNLAFAIIEIKVEDPIRGIGQLFGYRAGLKGDPHLVLVTVAQAWGAVELWACHEAGIEAWLLTLRQRLAEVEADTDEARRQRRRLVELLVEKTIVAENDHGGATVTITYRFSPPAREQGEPSEEISHRQRNFNLFHA
jgi:hypothetical protein